MTNQTELGHWGNKIKHNIPKKDSVRVFTWMKTRNQNYNKLKSYTEDNLQFHQA